MLYNKDPKYHEIPQCFAKNDSIRFQYHPILMPGNFSSSSNLLFRTVPEAKTHNVRGLQIGSCGQQFADHFQVAFFSCNKEAGPASTCLWIRASSWTKATKKVLRNLLSSELTQLMFDLQWLLKFWEWNSDSSSELVGWKDSCHLQEGFLYFENKHIKGNFLSIGIASMEKRSSMKKGLQKDLLFWKEGVISKQSSSFKAHFLC